MWHVELSKKRLSLYQEEVLKFSSIISRFRCYKIYLPSNGHIKLLLCDKIMIVHVFIHFVNSHGTHFRHVNLCGRQSSHYLLLWMWNKIRKTKHKFIFNGFLPKKNEWCEIIILLEYFLKPPTMWYGFVRVPFIAVRNNCERSLGSSRLREVCETK